MAAPTCDRCGRSLDDWQANIMVNDEEFTTKKEINAIEVVCKSCTVTLDRAGEEDLHNLWELSWIKRRFMGLLATVLADLTSDSPVRKWSKEAVERFWQLGSLALPETVRSSTDLEP